MRRVPRPALVVAALLLAACTAARPDPGFSTQPSTAIVLSNQGTLAVQSVGSSIASANSLALPIDSAWGRLPAAFDSLGIPVTTVRTADRILGNEALRVRRRLAGAPLSTYLNCGSKVGMPNADSYDVHLSILTQLRPDELSGGTATSVATLVEATAREAGGSAASVRCGSTGRLEERLFRALRGVPVIRR